jgi:hypothetical protein
VLAPIIARVLFAAGHALPAVALTLSLGSLISALVLILLNVDHAP